MPEEPSGRARALQIQTMFGRIVGRYDLMNRVMSGGRDGRWRTLAAHAALPGGYANKRPIVLDLGAGTGDLSRALRAAGAATVVAGDFSRPMLVAARRKLTSNGETGLGWAQLDALALPFADDTFDAVTSGFLLRNLVDLPQGLAEMVRVIKPGGALVALDMTHPPPGLAGAVLRFGFRRVMSPIAGALSGDRPAYRYLPNSLIGFPTAPEMSALLARVGVERVTARRLGGGSIALHVGRKPPIR